jgi:asparagine synthase (glutamine-hydrolysing)
MCGILLAVGECFRADFDAALARLRTRGPDAREVLAHGDALLGHARLAVIDIAGGRQPMSTADGRLAMVYNGEIYNFATLRSELEAAGHAFATRSDSEVLLTGYRHWGEAVLDKLDGMFAFAIHDSVDGSVFLARDRVGIKPLFWGEHAGGLVATSTLAPFLALRSFPKKLDAEGLRDYLAFQTPLAPRTLVRDIRALPPGACLRWKAGAATTPRQWWTIPDASDAAPDPDTLVEETDVLLATAVKDQLVADVPLGAFLSGGIDSSLVVHYMAQAGATPIRTFSVRFAEAGFDESPAARAVAEKYATEHHVLDAPQLDAATLAAALADLDQPLADPAYIPTWALSRLTRQHVTVALSGDGGDELFGGYPRFLDTADQHPDSVAKRALRALIARGLAPAGLTRRALAAPSCCSTVVSSSATIRAAARTCAATLRPKSRAARPEATLERWRELAARHGNYDRGALLRADLWTYLSENCLPKTDRASMGHGLEVRVPLLANAIQDRMLRLPAQVHFECAALVRAQAAARRSCVRWRAGTCPRRCGIAKSTASRCRCAPTSRAPGATGATPRSRRLECAHPGSMPTPSPRSGRPPDAATATRAWPIPLPCCWPGWKPIRWTTDVNPIKHLLFILRQRRAGNRVSFSAYLKGIDRIELGRGCKIHADASVDASRSSGVRFGDKVTLNRYAYVQGGEGGVRLGHRVEINNFSIVNGTGGVDIGDDTLVGPGVRIISYQHRHARETTIRTQAVDARPIRIGRDCWLGANSVILAGVTIGDGAVVAAGAVVRADVPDFAIVAGVPASVKKYRE